VLLDYGWSRCEAIVRDAKFPENAKLRAFLELEADGRVISLPADAIQADAERETLRLVFTSLMALNLSARRRSRATCACAWTVDGDEPAAVRGALPGRVPWHRRRPPRRRRTTPPK
jgi:hypothetical protein